MIDHLIQIDRLLFTFLNVTLANPVTDVIMPVVTSDDLLRALYAAVMVLLLWRGNWRLRWLVLFSALTLAATDQLSSNLVKELVARPRPCQTLAGIHLLINCGAGFSFPSSHAANAFGQAALFAYHVRSSRRYLLALAALIALSRVLVGVHYPADILAGAVLGAAVGLALALLFMKLVSWRVIREHQDGSRAG